MLVSEADIPMADPAGLAARLVDHLVEHEVEFETRDGCTVADLGRGRGSLSVSALSLTVRIEAADRGDLEMLRAVFASHIVEFADEPLEIAWSGLEDTVTTFANFREIRLLRAADLTPHLRRLTFAGPDLARFATDDDLHVRLYFPPPDCAEPEWPRPGADGRTLWPADEKRPEPRYYTLRRIDPSAGEVDIDFVMHADAGPGADFAARAEAGARLGMAGPIGRTVAPAAWHLLAGDETALPAIARILETLPRDAQGQALIEVAGPEEEIPLSPPPGLPVTWLHRGAAPAGCPERLRPALTGLALPEDAFVWIGCEFDLAKTLRRHFEKELGLARERSLIVGYWARD